MASKVAVMNSVSLLSCVDHVGAFQLRMLKMSRPALHSVDYKEKSFGEVLEGLNEQDRIELDQLLARQDMTDKNSCLVYYTAQNWFSTETCWQIVSKPENAARLKSIYSDATFWNVADIKPVFEEFLNKEQEISPEDSDEDTEIQAVNSNVVGTKTQEVASDVSEDDTEGQSLSPGTPYFGGKEKQLFNSNLQIAEKNSRKIEPDSEKKEPDDSEDSVSFSSIGQADYDHYREFFPYTAPKKKNAAKPSEKKEPDDSEDSSSRSFSLVGQNHMDYYRKRVLPTLK